jgi:hypothetical protein
MMRNLLLAFVCVLSVVSCKKDKPKTEEEPIALVTTPEAVAEHDSKSGGIYKGILVGSTGTIKISLQGGSSTAVLTFNGETRTLTTNSLNNWSSGQAISNAVFSSGNWTMNFSVDPNGQNASIAVTIPNHSVGAELVKETSTTLVQAFEGTYSGAATGTWNFVVRGNAVRGIRKWSQDNVKVPISGTLNGTTLNGQGYTGTINGNSASGTWTEDTPQFKGSGTWTGKRTL